MSRGLCGLAALLLAAPLAGCAATAPGSAAKPGVSRANGAVARETAVAPATRSPAARVSVVPADSLPSEDALNVLKTIPEPLAPGEVVPAAETGAPPNPADTAGVSADSASIVPTPSLTTPLGERPGSASPASKADSLARLVGLAPAAPSAAGAGGGIKPAAPGGPSIKSGGGAAAATAGAAGGAGAAASGAAAITGTPAASDTCWRVQVAAPSDSSEAEELRLAAESQLLVPMAIVEEGNRFKVQSRDCVDEAASAALRSRALAAGFDGAFRTRTVTRPPPSTPPPASKPRSPASSGKKSPSSGSAGKSGAK